MPKKKPAPTLMVPIEVSVHGELSMFLRMAGGEATGKGFTATVASDVTGSSLIVTLKREGAKSITMCIGAPNALDAMLKKEAELRKLVE